jgi:hypothetical protein
MGEKDFKKFKYKMLQKCRNILYPLYYLSLLKYNLQKGKYLK